MSLHVIIPCKTLGDSKSRLSIVLDEKQRRDLSLRLLAKTMSLAALLTANANCHVVTDDPQAKSDALAAGLQTIADPGLGLNAALDTARKQIWQQDKDCRLLVLPIDLPHASADALCELLGSDASVAIAPDRKLDGTNALYLGPDAAAEFPFRFGANSFTLHCGAAHEKGLKLGIYASAALAFDLDTPEQLQEI